MRSGICIACQAPILWVKTRKDKDMPLDPKPQMVVRVENYLDPDRVTTHEIADVVKAYVPHWATCPAADRFRKKKEPESA